MQITVTIPDDVAAEVKARGLTPESYVERLIAEHRTTAQSPVESGRRLAALERFFDGISVHSERIPLLPDEAFTRESIYSDHD